MDTQFSFLTDVNSLEWGWYKFVRFDDNVVLFMSVVHSSHSHLSMAKTRPGAKPISAGTVKFDPINKEFAITNFHSSSLNLNSIHDDDEVIAKKLGNSWAYNPELMY